MVHNVKTIKHYVHNVKNLITWKCKKGTILLCSKNRIGENGSLFEVKIIERQKRYAKENDKGKQSKTNFSWQKRNVET